MSEKIIQLNGLQGNAAVLAAIAVNEDGFREGPGVSGEIKEAEAGLWCLRNVFCVVPKSKAKIAAKMLKVVRAQEHREAFRKKAKAVAAVEHRTRIRANNGIWRLGREIRRGIRVVGTFPDGSSALMSVCARLRHAAGIRGTARST